MSHKLIDNLMEANMTWVSDKKDKEEKKTKKSLSIYQKKLEAFNLQLTKHLLTIQEALDEVKKQGLDIYKSNDTKPIPLFKETLMQHYTDHCPWDFDAKESDLTDEQKIVERSYEFGMVWNISLPDDSRVCVNVCFFADSMVFRSGYNYKSIIIPQGFKNMFHGSHYGLETSPTTRLCLDNPLTKQIYFANYHYGETVLNKITKKEIVETVRNWFEYASENPYKK